MIEQTQKQNAFWCSYALRLDDAANQSNPIGKLPKIKLVLPQIDLREKDCIALA